MKYEIGDKIIVLLTNEEGQVVELLNEKMVMVEVKGVRFPAYMDQIDFPYFKMFTEKRLVDKKPRVYIDDVKKEKSSGKQQVSEGMWLSFLPVFDKDVFDDDVVEKFKLHLVNQETTAFAFTYNFMIGGQSDYQLKNSIEPLADFYLHDIRFDSMSDSPRFDFEFSLATPEKKKAPYYETSLKLRGKQLFKKIEEIRMKNEPTFSYRLFEHYPDKMVEEKFDMTKLNSAGFRVYDVARAREQMEQARSVVDLHIEKLTDSWKHLSNFEILSMQLKTFEKYYDLAVAHYQPSLTIIHGVGVGKLRDEIHEILKNKKEVKSFVNQYNSNYGYGATEIWFSY